jgi:phage replication-related protein YjqB (UPF0714/DUF867 family)
MRTHRRLQNGLMFLSLAAAGCGVGATSDAVDGVGAAREAFSDSGLTVSTPASGTIADEHCRLPAALHARYPVGTQIRLVNTNNSPNTIGLCTVDDADSASANVEMNKTYLAKRLGVAANTTSVSNVTITNEYSSGNVGIATPWNKPSPPAKYQDITTYPGIVEWSSTASPSGRTVAYTAPHGFIEAGTMNQLSRVFSSASTWDAHWAVGYRETSGTTGWDFFHITSSDISEDSFLELAPLLQQFRYAVSFHGCSDGCNKTSGGQTMDVAVGGREAEPFRRGVVEVIQEWMYERGVSGTVGLPTVQAGTDLDNFVNRLTISQDHGLQIEQSDPFRGTNASPNTANLNAVADAVKSVYDCLEHPVDAADIHELACNSSVDVTVSPGAAGVCPSSDSTYHAVADLRGVIPTSPCTAGARLHLSVYRQDGDATWRRVSGGFWEPMSVRIISGGWSYAWVKVNTTDSPYLEPAAGDYAPGTFRVVARLVDANKVAQPVSVKVLTTAACPM